MYSDYAGNNEKNNGILAPYYFLGVHDYNRIAATAAAAPTPRDAWEPS